MKISACMIVKNESQNIERSIASYRDIVSEIIVVDTGSSDNTVELAQKMGAKVLFMEWNNDFSAPKNYAIDHATGDWIIFLDADEYFASGSSHKVLQALNQLEMYNEFNCLGCKMYHLNGSEGSVKGQNTVNRIFKRKANIRYRNSIHETLLEGDKPLNSLYFEDIVIYHTGYSESQISRKFRRNIEILRSEELKGNADSMTYYYLCTSHFGLMEFDKAIEYANKAFREENLSGLRIPDIYRYRIYTSKIQAMGLLGDRYTTYEINKVVKEAVNVYPKHPEVLWCQAQLLTRKKLFRDALSSYLLAIEYHRSEAANSCNYFEGYIDQAYCDIGAIYTYMNDEKTAVDFFVRALKKNKYNKDAAIRLLRTIRFEKDELVISLINELYRVDEFVELKFVIEILCEAKLPIPLIYFSKRWNSRFEQEDISILLSMLAMGKYDDAIQIGLVTAKIDDTKPGLAISVAGILLTNSRNIYLNELREVDENACHLLETLITERETVFIEDGTIALLKEIADIIIAFSNQVIVTNFMDTVLRHASENAAYLIFDRLLYFSKYELAANYYSRLYNDAKNMEIKGKSSFISAFSYYRTKDFDKATEWLMIAMENNYSEEIPELVELIKQQCHDESLVNIINQLENHLGSLKSEKLNIGCGRDIRPGWVNLDYTKLPGVDVVADLNDCANTPLPFEDNTFDEILASHVIEHIESTLPLMQELHRIAKPGAKAVFMCPYGSSDDAFEDPTHVRQYFINSFGYFSQPYYWRADYGYRGDWKVESIQLSVEYDKFRGLSKEEILDAVHSRRNVVKEMVVELSAVKPLRKTDKTLQDKPPIRIEYLGVASEYGLFFDACKRNFMLYPKEVHIETTGRCNAKCIFCPHDQIERKTKDMEDSVFMKIVGDLKEIPKDHKFWISPFKVNEPLLDKKIFERIQVLNQELPNAMIRFFSNFNNVKPEDIENLSRIKNLDSLWISLNSVHTEEYKQIMGLDLKRTLENMEMLFKFLMKNRFITHITVSRVIMGNAYDGTFANDLSSLFSQYKEFIQPVLIEQAEWIDHKNHTKQSSFLHEPCARWFELSITCTGEVALCCMDGNCSYKIGDVRQNSVLDIYNNNQYKQLREKCYNRSSVSPCKDCINS